MLFNILAVVGSAAIDENNLCEHHPEHTAECGYVEGESECTYSCEECTVIIKPTIASGTSEWTTNPEPEMVSVTHHSEYDISWYTSNTEVETFYIDDVADLVGLMFLVNYGPDGVWDSENELFTDGSSTSDNVTFEGKTIELRSDLKLNGDYNVLGSDGKLDLTNVDSLKKWKPIGAGYNYFKGTFDGKDHTISGLYMPLVKDTYTVDSALFGRLSGATIKNVKITDSYLYGSSKYKSSDVYVGGLVAHMTKSTVDNCAVDARIICDCPDISTRYQNAGGVVGYVSSGSDGNTVISNCVFNGDIVANVTSVGGILGRTYDSASAMIENCINNGYIENNVYRDFSGIGTGAYFATAGIFGYGAAKIKNCINYGTVKGMRSYIAGIAGKPTSVENCENLGTVTQVDTCITPEKGWYVYIGGIVAECSSVTNCVNGSPEDSTLGNITAIAYCGNMGGIAAVSHGDVTGCVNYAPIKDDTSKYVENRTSFYSLGGIVGYMSPLKVDIAITDCVNYGDITGSGEGTTYYKAEKVAGILGDIQISNSASYYGNVTISECINKGDITSPNHAAGINGYNYTSDNSTYKGRFYITNCYNIGDIASTDNTYFSHAGGIIAYNNVANGVGPIVSGVYNIGAVSRGYTSGKVGGIAGYAYGTYTDAYYLDTGVTNPNTTGTAKTLAQFNSGEVAYLLQEGQTATDEYGDVIHVWGQHIDVELYPVLNGKKVYKTTRCDTGEEVYANRIDGKHIWDDNGFCLCGAYEDPDVDPGEDPEWDYDDIYLVENAGQLFWIADYVNNISNEINVLLTTDIRIPEGKEWTPIINFYGTFDGNFKTISGLNASGDEYVGMFGGGSYAYGTIKNLHITNSRFEGTSYVGALAGYHAGNIYNCYVDSSVTVTGDSSTGLLVGHNAGAVQNCYAYGSSCVGYYDGNYSTVENCYYLSETETEDGGKTAEQFARGEVAYLLQQGNTEQVWGQDNNQAGATPVFDATGLYKVVTVGETCNYSVANVGDTNGDGTVDVIDYQALVNKALADDHEQIETANYDDIVRYDLDGDGYLDVIDAYLLHLFINGFATVDVYAVGDYDLNGVAFEEADLKAIKHAIENPETLATYKKYASDINGDGKLDENDLTALTSKYGEVTGTECADNVEVYYRWGNKYSTCTATAMCTLCGKKVATETVNSVQNADGSYTATFTNTLLGTKTYKK